MTTIYNFRSAGIRLCVRDSASRWVRAKISWRETGMKFGYALLIMGLLVATVQIAAGPSRAATCDYSVMGDVNFCGP